MSANSRIALVLLMGLGLWADLGAEVWWWGGGILRLPLPIARGQGFPVPLLYWAGVILYSQVYGALFHLPRALRWTWALWLGVGLHALALIAALPGWSAVNSDSLVGLSVWYVRYWQAVWVLTAAWGGAWLWTVVSARRRSWTADPVLFFVPFIGGYIALWLSARAMPAAITLAAVGLTMGFAVAWHLNGVRRWGDRLLQWLGREQVFVTAVFLIALAFRLFYMTRILSVPDFLNTGSDGPAYDALAWSLVHGGETRWSHMTMFAPGYVRFVALIYGVFGRSYLAVCVAQSVIGAGACLLLYHVAKRLFDPMVARIAAIFAALNFPMIFAAAAIGHQALDLFWTLLVVWCLVRYTQAPQRWGRWMPGVGLLLGWATLTREGNGVFWLFLLGWFLLGVRAALGWRRALLHVTGLSLGFLIVLLPFVGPNGSLYSRLGGHWFVYPHSGFNLHEWFNPWVDPNGALVLLREQPWEVVVRLSQGVIANFSQIFLNHGFGTFDPVFLLRGSLFYYGMWGYAYALVFLGFGLILVGAIHRPIQRLGWWVVLLVLVSRTLVHLFLEAAYRHRPPFEPYLIMCAAVGLSRLINLGRAQAVRVSHKPEGPRSSGCP